MSEAFVSGGVGGKKVITLDDCTIVDRTYGKTLTFPSGVTWGDIDRFAAISVNASGWNVGVGFAKIDGKLNYHNTSSWRVATHQPPVDSDNYIYMFVGSYAGTPMEVVAILK